ncbi:hypothetical protein FAES_1033 [Fibrella aestuarina BUZ 2]|uniref:Uncharacterized protein n=1 Tax=Fibrella aestuarina BUZ 2 TaxID=1166018 RepID=I0K4J1_9BACT|nr:hypothetical protein FAES_1033 [Fibrella aestuarina BUZ 2]
MDADRQIPKLVASVSDGRFFYNSMPMAAIS